MSGQIDAKPQPHPTPESQPYWDAAAEGSLRLQHCAACGTVRHYPRLVCARCYSLAVDWKPASGRGRVHSWTVAHHAFHPVFKAELPYTLVIVDLAEGPRMLGRLDPASVARLCIGLPVRLRFEPGTGGFGLPVFFAEDSA